MSNLAVRVDPVAFDEQAPFAGVDYLHRIFFQRWVGFKFRPCSIEIPISQQRIQFSCESRASPRCEKKSSNCDRHPNPCLYSHDYLLVKIDAYELAVRNGG